MVWQAFKTEYEDKKEVVKVGDQYHDIVVHDVSEKGQAVTKINDGLICFVEGENFNQYDLINFTITGVYPNYAFGIET